MKDVKFETEFAHQVDPRTTKTWPAGWSGELADSVAFAGRRAGALAFVGEGAEEAETEFVAAEEVAKAEAERAEAARLEAEAKKGGKGNKKGEGDPALV